MFVLSLLAITNGDGRHIKTFKKKGGNMKIEESTNYKIFTFLGGNRMIDRLHLRAIKRSIQTKNLLKYSPIIVNDKNQIIDGQHRFLAAQELEIPFYFIRANDMDLNDVILLNVSTTRWKLGDYLNTYIEQGNENYMRLKDFQQRHHISLSMAIAYLSMPKKKQVQAPITEFKNGNWEITNEKESESFADFIHEIGNYCEEYVTTDRDFSEAIYWITYKRETTNAELLEAIKTHTSLIRRNTNKHAYIRQLEEIFNGKRAGSKKFRYFM